MFSRCMLQPHRERLAAALPGTTLFTSTREDPLYFTCRRATNEPQFARALKNSTTDVSTGHHNILTSPPYPVIIIF